jgi:hypothetical protein
MDDDDLTEKEREALAALPNTAPLPQGFEDRVAEALRARGLLTGGNRMRSRGRTVLRSAVAAGLFVAGAGAGFLLGRPAAPAPERGGLYLLLLLSDSALSEGGPDDERARVAEYGAWAETLRREGGLVLAERLEARGRIVEGAASGAPVEGPQGFFLVRARDFEEAQRITRTCPHVRRGGRVAVHAVDPT